jgi:isochorismate hydrolase
MIRNIAELSNLINQEFTKKGDTEVLTGLRKQMISSSAEDNQTALKTLKARGININDEEFQMIKDYTAFEAQNMSKMMRRTGIMYIIIGVIVAAACLVLRNRLAVFGAIATLSFIFFGVSVFKKSKN